jgi:hypothetical protein
MVNQPSQGVDGHTTSSTSHSISNITHNTSGTSSTSDSRQSTVHGTNQSTLRALQQGIQTLQGGLQDGELGDQGPDGSCLDRVSNANVGGTLGMRAEATEDTR